MMLRALISDFNRAARSIRPSCLAFGICWLDTISDREEMDFKGAELAETLQTEKLRILSKTLMKYERYMFCKQNFWRALPRKKYIGQILIDLIDWNHHLANARNDAFYK